TWASPRSFARNGWSGKYIRWREVTRLLERIGTARRGAHLRDQVFFSDNSGNEKNWRSLGPVDANPCRASCPSPLLCCAHLLRMGNESRPRKVRRTDQDRCSVAVLGRGRALRPAGEARARP